MSGEPNPSSALGQWIAELRERHVLHVLAVYLVGAWVVLQVADVAVLPALGIPDAGMRYVVIAVGVGFVITAVLAWRYEITRRGIVPHASRHNAQPGPAVLRRSDRLFIASMAAFSLLTIAGAAVKLLDLVDLASGVSPTVEHPVIGAPPGSLAVLPFANLNNDPELEYFGDGLAEELVNRLVSVPTLSVTARTSAFRFKGRAATAKEVGAALGVAHVIVGSVRRSRDALRVTVQLVNTTNELPVWSSTYDRTLSDAFAIQDEIAQSVLDSLQVVLTPQQQTALLSLSQHSTTNPDAHDLYLRARHLYQSFQLERMDKAITYYEEAIRLDPTFAAAYVGLADALGWRRVVVGSPPTDSVNARIPALLRKALELDPGNGDAHALLGKELWLTYDFKGAERELQHAEALSPNGHYVVEKIMAYYMIVGWPPERAIAYARKGRQLDPLSPWAVIHVAQAHWHAHQYDEALIELERVFEIDPDFWLAHVWQSIILTDLERYREALPAARRAVELNEGPGTLSSLAVAHINLGEIDEAHAVIARLEEQGATKGWDICLALKDYQCALAELEQLYALRDPWLPEVLHHKSVLPLHGEPRFQRLVRLLGQERRVEHTARLNQRVADGG